ncbi:MAG: FAD-dependent oxidoreductase [Burkholderiaceae bacterium]
MTTSISDSQATEPELTLAFGLTFDDLQTPGGLSRLDQAYVNWLADTDAPLHSQLTLARADGAPSERLAESELLIAVAASLDGFVAQLFQIEPAVSELCADQDALGPVLRVKYKFVKRKALLAVEQVQREQVDAPLLASKLAALGADPFDEPAFSQRILTWTDETRSKDAAIKAQAKEALAFARDYAAWAAGTDAGRLTHRRSVLFDHPRQIDPLNKIEHLEQATLGSTAAKVIRIKVEAQHQRDGFRLTDPGADLAGGLDQSKYCLLCHKSGKDSCSKGLPDDAPSMPFKKSPLGDELAGCPLEERISEFHQLKLEGSPIGALAMITLDNPMVAATGHRICNDCIKSCIFQQQTPVDTPKAETRVLRDVLELPWGFEIYSLLTRWNPLNLTRWIPAVPGDHKVLIVGAGPAGFTLAHYLLNAGHQVTLVDGLKIEPSSPLSGPVHRVASLEEPLDERIGGGFGGVAEYGITVRWNKNYLTLIRAMLERRNGFALHGGVRFGGTLSTEQAFALGFDHIALCTGAGRPTLLNIPGGLAPGVRAASDFLMSLQLTGASRRDSLANLQVRLPAVVVGGGLTAMDTATETLAYYLEQIEKFLARHEAMVTDSDEATVRAQWTKTESTVADEFIAHAMAVRAERAAAMAENRPPRLIKLLNDWGGVTLAYRKRLIDSPAYRLNPEEVANALGEGISVLEGAEPIEVKRDEFGHCEALLLRSKRMDDSDQWISGDTMTLPARTVFVAAGTHPNAVLAQEETHLYSLSGDFFAAVDTAGNATSASAPAKAAEVAFFAHLTRDGRAVSFLGDAHPAFAGNVVKAMSSAKKAAPVISAKLAETPAASSSQPDQWQSDLTARLTARVVRVERLAPGIVEVVVHAPAAAAAFRPGQFYRLQNFERSARTVSIFGQTTRLSMEGLAMTGAWTNATTGELGMVVLEMGGSSDLCAYLEPDEPVVLMGPTGEPTEIVSAQNVVLIGGGLGNAVLFSIGAALKAAGCRVLYVAGYKCNADRFRPEDLEAAADQIIWCSDQAPGFSPRRAGDQCFTGNVVQAIDRLLEPGESTRNLPFALRDTDRVITIGSDRMMAAVAQACRTQWATTLRPDVTLIASINSPMQCMMKAICAQCVQRHVDPQTGASRLVFSCANQDQPMNQVDFECLADRLSQNSLQEKQTKQWLGACLAPR